MFIVYTPEQNDFLCFKRNNNTIEDVLWTGIVADCEIFEVDDKDIAIYFAKDIQQARIKNNITSLSIQVLAINAIYTVDFDNPIFEIKAKHHYSSN